MIDSICLLFVFNEFRLIGGSLRNCRPVSSKKETIKYANDDCRPKVNNDGQPKVIKEMFLPNPRHGHSLRVMIDEYGRTRIKGSLRKWYFGSTSYKDLSKQQYLEAVEELAKSLHISVSDIMSYGKLTHIELGYTIQTKTNPASILKRIKKYGRVKTVINYQNKNKTVYGFGTDKRLRVYNKTLEIPANTSWKKRGKVFDELDNLSRCGIHLLRIEIEMFYRKSFINSGFREIKTLNDIYENWDNLIALTVREYSKIKLVNKLELSLRMTPNELRLAQSIIKHKNFQKGIEEYAVENGQNIKQVERDGYSLLERYSSMRTYSIRSFRKDIARHLIKIDRNIEKLSLSKLFHLLWRTKQGRRIKLADSV